MQGDLFTAQIYTFPVARTARVGQMARFLAVVQGERADAYYRKTCRRIAADLRKIGASEPQIRVEIEAFSSAVRLELEALICPAAEQSGDAA